MIEDPATQPAVADVPATQPSIAASPSTQPSITKSSNGDENATAKTDETAIPSDEPRDPGSEKK
jgi:hypothetical protein